jgi:hypothetical protein
MRIEPSSTAQRSTSRERRRLTAALAAEVYESGLRTVRRNITKDLEALKAHLEAS